MRRFTFILLTFLATLLCASSLDQQTLPRLWHSWSVEYHTVKLRVALLRHGHSPQSRIALQELHDALRP
jgi:hypothetical protein